MVMTGGWFTIGLTTLMGYEWDFKPKFTWISLTIIKWILTRRGSGSSNNPFPLRCNTPKRNHGGCRE
jgi:hypothetical protein